MSSKGPQVISSQRYRDDDIVEAKREAEDYDVYIYAIELDGVDYEVVVDGHHSLEAARLAGKEPNWLRIDDAVEREYNSEVKMYGTVEWSHLNDSPYYDVHTGEDVW